jgi:hypothetical protein
VAKELKPNYNKICVLSPYFDMFECCEAIDYVYKPHETRDFIFDAKHDDAKLICERMYDSGDFIYNSSVIKQMDALFLDSSNPYIYNYNGVLISRNKVLKNYSFLKKQYPGYDKQHLLESSIIHNSIMDVDDAFRINKIISSIMDFPKQKRI